MFLKRMKVTVHENIYNLFLEIGVTVEDSVEFWLQFTGMLLRV